MRIYQKINDELLADYDRLLKARADYFRQVYDSFCIRRCFSSYLDIGCGKGYNTRAFAKGIRKAVGIDKSKKDLAMAKKLLKGSRITLAVGDSTALRFHDKEFNFITAFSVLEHVSNLDTALREIRRVLSDDGILVLQQPNNHFIVELHTYLPFVFLLTKRLRFFLLGKLGFPEEDIFATLLSLKELKGKLRKNGFKMRIKRMIYPSEIMPERMRLVYHLLASLGIFTIIPFGFMLVCEKQ